MVAGGVTMWVMALAIGEEMRDFPGGPAALAVGVEAGAEAMRILRWPAERLDTLGGYVTYHNVVFVNLFLVVYGAVQGAKAIRGTEERHALEEVRATGVPRPRIVRDRTLGFVLVAVTVCLALALGTAAGLAGGDAPDVAGALITFAASAAAAVVGYGLGLFAGQLTTSSRAAAGASSLVVTAWYVLTNLGDELGPVAFLQYLSPFTYANRSRALVPGYGFDLPATAVLVALAAVLIGAATWAFLHRDHGAALWVRRRAAQRPVPAATVPTALLSSVWSATLRRGRVGLVAWALGAGAVTALMAFLEPVVMDVWSAFDFIGALAGGDVTTDTSTVYWSFVGALLSPVVAAYVVVQASGWVADLADGRVEMLLAGPVSWTRLVIGRLVGVLAGVLVITAVALGTLVVGAASVDAAVDLAGLARLAVTTLLFAAAIGAVAALLVAWLRRGIAVTGLAVVVATSYLIAYLVPFLDWPEWLNRLSVFWAFGQPYLEWPTATRLTVLGTLALAGAVVAVTVAERSRKVA